MSAGIDYLRNVYNRPQDRPEWRTTPEKCADHGHPGVTYRSQPYAIEHAGRFTYLHIEGWRAHQLRGEWEVTVG